MKHPRSQAMLLKVRDAGVSIAIDDFWAGLLCSQPFADVPLSTLKILRFHQR
jgi:EAL domain-containing protein (putative c-di-GMP-specific phosphodiesterase class I)